MSDPPETENPPDHTDLGFLYQKFKRCIVRVVRESDIGDLETGTGFHIGDGYLVTARHLLGGRSIAVHGPFNQPLQIDRILEPEDPAVDLAVLATDFSLDHYLHRTTIIGFPESQKVDAIPIASTLDDWVGDELVGTRILLPGYPRIPLTDRPTLVAVAGEVNAVVTKYVGDQHIYFVVSPLARGGFSGGPLLSEWGFAIGVLLEGLVQQGSPVELGFAAAIGLGPLFDLLIRNRIFPGLNAEHVREFDFD